MSSEVRGRCGCGPVRNGRPSALLSWQGRGARAWHARTRVSAGSHIWMGGRRHGPAPRVSTAAQSGRRGARARVGAGGRRRITRAGKATAHRLHRRRPPLPAASLEAVRLGRRLPHRTQLRRRQRQSAVGERQQQRQPLRPRRARTAPSAAPHLVVARPAHAHKRLTWARRRRGARQRARGGGTPVCRTAHALRAHQQAARRLARHGPLLSSLRRPFSRCFFLFVFPRMLVRGREDTSKRAEVQGCQGDDALQAHGGCAR